MRAITSRYGVVFGSFVHTGRSRYFFNAGVTYPFIASTQGPACSGESMKRRYSFAALGKREYLKMNAWLKSASSVGLPTGPMG